MVGDDEHLVLVGLMGVGKTTVGRILAERLRRPLRDSDLMIEAETGRTVRQIFADDGEPAFRLLETTALTTALDDPVRSVIAAAGGVVLSAENRAQLRGAAARVVWLRADPDSLVERVKAGGHRPAIDDDPRAKLRLMAETRESLYREVADVIISIDGRSVYEVVDAVLR